MQWDSILKVMYNLETSYIKVGKAFPSFEKNLPIAHIYL